ncbi:MAG: prepilin-type N-terminal cleavage/methylation domain-containing protein [Planctomycetes bacterium]|nr:prepilin-type N-terminal cleavage/methylation domain-containing protein [Planctomycetota bacterium]
MKARRGFTLVELMLAVLILAIMMSIIYGVVVSTVSAARRVEEITATSEIGPAILTQIRADLEAAFLPKEGEFFVASKRAGAGNNRDRIDFVSGVMAYGPENEIEAPRFHSVNEVGYQLLESRKDPGLAILYRREDYFIDAEPLKGGRLTELYDRVRSFSLRFREGDKWRDDWNSKTQKGLPRAVEIELKIQVTDREKPAEQTFKTTVTFVR